MTRKYIYIYIYIYRYIYLFFIIVIGLFIAKSKRLNTLSTLRKKNPTDALCLGSNQDYLLAKRVVKKDLFQKALGKERKKMRFTQFTKTLHLSYQTSYYSLQFIEGKTEKY